MTSSVVDPDTEFGAHVAERLDSDQIAWLTTVGPSGTPQPNPVWFLWSDGTLLIFSRPDQAKIRNIRRNPRISVHLNSTETGGDVVVFTGTAHIEEVPPGDAETGALLAKYAEGLESLNLTGAEFTATYSAAIRIVPDRLRGF
ncbi:TIGR03667 family PPOX class F420-dependent oxidoreductase [Nocardia asteroides]|uniref:TIGR03667 family PPOX class F420-dependent oxidoreductase n=1 Tax=Nocardia asteroides TaxID=1824 RepID=UPI001E421372|nr:TIGR03667 family PPOX class F420-dependent oxidoreductase [Nocardia asteroides]UGT59950.1 TIGR03667 family PPOX class F420-dependent oxidoreductase [Nocardia asteroides]